MNTRLQKILTRVHFVTLAIAILNSLFKHFANYSLSGNIEMGVEALVVLSGLVLFFFYLKPFKGISLYFSVYATAAFLFIIGVIFRGIFWAIVLSILLFPLIPEDTQYEENGIIITVPFQGFLAPCCSYQIKERQFLIFEKGYGIWNLEGEGPIQFETVSISSSEDEFEITYSTTFDEGIMKKKRVKR
ncbi:MAG: hypothetical protein AB8F95_13110 [Bacteroidia bacterium]